MAFSNSPTETLREQVKRILLPRSIYESLSIPMSVLDQQVGNEEVAITIDDAPGALAMFREQQHAHQVIDLNLDEIFEAFVAGRKEADDRSVPEEVAAP